MGKTALLERFYNQLFIQQDEVVPFYASFAEFKGFERTFLTIRRFMRYYLRTLVAQYLAFHLRDSKMARFIPGMEESRSILQEQRAHIPAAGAIERYLNYALEATAETYRDYLPDIIQFTRRALGVAGRIPGILMIARLVLTDSGGIQEETTILGIPCLTLREETEWVETVEAGWNLLVGADRAAIVRAAREFRPVGSPPPLFGDGHASERIVALLVGQGHLCPENAADRSPEDSQGAKAGCPSKVVVIK